MIQHQLLLVLMVREWQHFDLSRVSCATWRLCGYVCCCSVLCCCSLQVMGVCMCLCAFPSPAVNSTSHCCGCARLLLTFMVRSRMRPWLLTLLVLPILQGLLDAQSEIRPYFTCVTNSHTIEIITDQYCFLVLTINTWSGITINIAHENTKYSVI